MRNQHLSSSLGEIATQATMPVAPRMKAAKIGALIFTLFFLAGCGGSETDTEDSEKEASNNGELKVALGDHESLDKLIANNKGKIVVVDFWATWCEPCVENLPHAIEFAAEHKDELTLITVSMDEPDENKKVTALLKSKNAVSPAMQSDMGQSQEAWEGFDLEDGTPWYRVYDREGKLVAESAEFSDLEPKIKDLFAAN